MTCAGFIRYFHVVSAKILFVLTTTTDCTELGNQTYSERSGMF